MKKRIILILVIAFLSFSCESQSQNEKLLNSAIGYADSLIIKSTSKSFYTDNMQLNKEETKVGYSYLSADGKGFVDSNFNINDLDKMKQELNNISLVYNIKDGSGNVIGGHKQLFLIKNQKIQSLDNYDLDGLKDFFSLYVKTVQDEYIGYDKAIEIAAKHGFDDLAEYRLHEDGNWDFGRESEEEKPIWTFKKHHTDTNNLRCYKVLKLNANTGKIESEFIEYPID